MNNFSNDLSTPSTRYQGSKRRLLPWIQSVLTDLSFDSALDLMCGTCSVSYMLKTMGKTVYANDYLKSNYFTATAVVENDAITLNNSEISWLTKRHSEVNYKNYVAKYYRDYYFLRSENAWIDTVISNIIYRYNNPDVVSKYKKSIALYGLFQACLMKRPFNLFHRKNLYLRTADVERQFGNKATWDRSFSELFSNRICEINQFVFANKKDNRALNYDALRVKSIEPDLVYIDPPYFHGDKRSIRHDYRNSYHFIEGLAMYEDWPSHIDHDSPIRALKPNGASNTDLYNCSVHELENRVKNWLTRVIEPWSSSTIVISYKHPGLPSPAYLKRILVSTGKKVRIKKRPHVYALNRSNGIPNKNLEVLLIAE